MRKFKTLFLLLFLLVTVCSQAQVKWGVKAGWNMSGALIKDQYGYTKVKLQPGFHIGGTADVALSEKFAMQPALLFTTKGFKLDGATQEFGASGLDKISFTTRYLELPINFIYRPRVGNTHLLLGAGPYLAYAVGGKWKAESDGMSMTGKLKFANDFLVSDSTLMENSRSRTVPFTKAFDFGANILLGAEITPNLYMHINGQIGLINLEPTYNGVRDERSSIKNAGGGISIGYKF